MIICPSGKIRSLNFKYIWTNQFFMNSKINVANLNFYYSHFYTHILIPEFIVLALLGHSWVTQTWATYNTNRNQYMDWPRSTDSRSFFSKPSPRTARSSRRIPATAWNVHINSVTGSSLGRGITTWKTILYKMSVKLQLLW